MKIRDHPVILPRAPSLLVVQGFSPWPLCGSDIARQIRLFSVAPSFSPPTHKRQSRSPLRSVQACASLVLLRIYVVEDSMVCPFFLFSHSGGSGGILTHRSPHLIAFLSLGFFSFPCPRFRLSPMGNLLGFSREDSSPFLSLSRLFQPLYRLLLSGSKMACFFK